MKKTTLFSVALLGSLLVCSCKMNSRSDVEGIISTEREFEQMADEKGVAEAFYHFAADSAVILRGGKIIKGKEAIKDYYQMNLAPGTKLQWAPDYTDVSGDLGYTYGKYTHRVADSTGAITESHGYFHTVWKKQADGAWRFVWD